MGNCIRSVLTWGALVLSATNLPAHGSVTETTNFCWAILTRESIDLKGGVTVDSFDSSSPVYSNLGLYDPAKRRDGGNIGSVGDTLTEITETGAVSVYGHAATGPQGTISVNGNSAIGSLSWIDGGNRGLQPGWYSQDLQVDLPDPELPAINFTSLSKQSGTVGGTNYDYVLPTGNYKSWQKFTLSSSSKMVIDGDVVIYFKQDFNITGSALVYLTPGSTLRIYLDGSASLSGRGVVNGSGLASRCRIYGLSSCATIEYSGSSSFIGTIYAPKAGVKLSGGGATNLNFVGAVVAKSAQLTGKYAFHYDESLCGSANHPPVANDDGYRTVGGRVLETPAPGILGNDMDPDGDALTAALVAGPAHGTLSLNSNGSFTYTPATGFLGEDAFTYRANDGALDSNVAAVRILVDLPINYCVAGASVDPTYGQGSGTHAFYLPGIGSDFVFYPSSGSLTEADAGTVNLTGTIRSQSMPGLVFEVDMVLSQYSAAPPSGSPKKELASAAYIENGGPIDPSTWVYFQSFSGTLTGTGDLAGAVLNLSRVGPSFQIGVGANGKNLEFGASAWFNWNVVSQPGALSLPATGKGDINVNLGGCFDARDDQYSTPRNQVLNIAAPGVLANDSGPAAATLHALLIDGPANGTVALNDDGSFTYAPQLDFVGTDHFTYVATDGSLNSNLATVTIQINAANRAPIANADSYTTAEDTVLTVPVPGVLGNDTDPDGDALTAVQVTQPLHGTVTFNADGSFVYTPAANYNGTDTFTYQASDGILTSSATTVNLLVTPVNDAPVAIPDNYTTLRNRTLMIAAPGVLVNDTDPDGDPITAGSVTQPAHGSVSLTTDGSFSYTPTANYTGPDSFTYRASDGTLSSAPATVTITVKASNLAPVAIPDNYTIAEDSVLTVVAPGVLANDSDPDGDPITAGSVTQPAHGTVMLTANGSFVYTPSPNYSGPDSFTYKASDGSLTSGAAIVTIVVTPVNDAPVANSDNFTTAEDTVLTITAPGVLANDTDPDGDSITAGSVTQPAHGTVALNANGSFVYTPAANYNGPDGFTYKASDGTLSSASATVTISVTPVNDAPVAVADHYTTAEDTALTIAAPGVLANDSDPDGDPITAGSVTQPAHGTIVLNPDGSFVYTPTANFNGSDNFTYRASDGVATSSVTLVTITVTPVADAPVANPDTYTTPEDVPLVIGSPGVLVNDTDADGDTLSAVPGTQPQHGSLALNANGSFTYTPAAGYNGDDTFGYQASDGTLTSAPALVTIHVTPVEDAPVANPDQYTTPEDVKLVVAAPGVLTNDTDQDGDALTTVLSAPPAHGDVALNADGSFTYTPAAGYNGIDTFTYRAYDGIELSGPATVTITITPVNDQLTALPDNYTTPEDTPLNVAAPGVLANDSNQDGGPLSAVLQDLPTHGTVSLFSNGRFSYLPAANFNGLDTFTYRAVDGTNSSAAVLVSIQVTPVNDPPVAMPDMYITPVNTTLAIGVPGVLGNDTDAESDPLSAHLVSQPSHGTVNLLLNGSFTYVPATDYSGPDSFTYQASDGLLTSSETTVSITVGTSGSNPGSVADSYETLEDKPLTIAGPGVLLNDSAEFGGNLLATLVGQPQHGSVSLSADGSFTYVPAANYNGPDGFQYLASDGAVSIGPVPVTLTVQPVNDPPSFTPGPDQLVQEDSGPVTVSGWATDISPGPPDESSQSVGFIVSADNNSLFSAPPAIDASGSLTYTPAAGAYGLAHVTVSAQDSGGTANGGVNTSAPDEFSIRVNSPPLVQVVSPEDGNTYFPHQVIPFAATATDPDGTVTNATLLIDGSPVRSFVVPPYTRSVSNLTVGAHVLTASARDDLGATGNSNPVGLNVIPSPPVTPLKQAFNFQVDLVEQTIRVDNPTPYPITAVRVLISNMPAGVRVFNATGTNDVGVPYVLYNREVPARSSVLMTVEYLTPLVQTIQSTLLGEIVPLAPPPPAAVGDLVMIKRMSYFDDGRVLLTFDSIKDRVYFIEYSEDLTHWKTAVPSITAVGEGIQWVDTGWPKTEGYPADVPERFYRVRVAPLTTP